MELFLLKIVTALKILNMVTDLVQGRNYGYLGEDRYKGEIVLYLGIQDLGYQQFLLIKFINSGKVIPVPLDTKFSAVKSDNFSNLHSILSDE